MATSPVLTPTDRGLQQSVIDELDWTPGIHPATIGVAVLGGVVTLAGEVASLPERIAAEKAALRVDGVRTVANEITVHGSAEASASDEEIARHVNEVLTWTTTLPTGSVAVTVHDGTVILTGTVDSDYQRRAARKAVQDVQSVRLVDNRIELSRRVSAVDAGTRIRNALRRDALIDAHNITVAVSDTTVRLTGTVRSYEERREAERTAWNSPHVQHVDNQIDVDAKGLR
ncbi:BON domain-containing protein [Herbiconiux sp. VKM Ac-1786]|uniref:BON domain-containing protein n=1 Tax=Herbiconiux sp. VKM Ac-1786 TaxID=2783824 RepID=UPI00188B5073|nr:BON domain-containing protein [Herbiconiux sp. VKM Ac-1786]MBF4571955.1 BON domain-containing protein [Herbiconiux sp. VKM Ac-1786]